MSHARNMSATVGSAPFAASGSMRGVTIAVLPDCGAADVGAPAAAVPLMLPAATVCACCTAASSAGSSSHT